MKQNQKFKNRKVWYFALPIVLLVIAGVAYFAYRHYSAKHIASDTKPYHTTTYAPASPGDNTANNERKSSPNPAQTLDNGPTASTTPASFYVKILSANVSSTNVHVGSLVSGVTTGTCTLTATKSGAQTVTVTANVQQDVNNYDCGALNIPTSNFSTSGTWTLTLTVTNGSQHTSDTRTIVIS